MLSIMPKARHDDLSEVIRLISGAFLGAYFNRPAEGVAAIEELLAKYGGQLGGQAVMYRMLAAKNFASMRAYAKMDSVFTYMLAYDAPYLDDQTRKGIASGLEQCRKIARLPRTEVIDRSREGSPGTVGMELEDGLFYLNAGYCGKSVKTLLDIGAEYTSIDQSLADELGVRIFQDSLRMSPASYMKLGILDSLQIGSITLKSEICCVFPDGLAARNREATADSGITRIRAMLGISTLRKLSALTVDVEHGTITFDTGKQPQTGIANFMLKDNIPYLWLELNGIPAMMHWDTGMNAKPRLSGKFYAEHASSLPELGPVRKGSEITAAGAAEYRYHALGGICAKIGSREVILPVRVVFDTEDMHTAEVPGYDGQMNNIVDVRRIRIDFENMCVTME